MFIWQLICECGQIIKSKTFFTNNQYQIDHLQQNCSKKTRFSIECLLQGLLSVGKKKIYRFLDCVDMCWNEALALFIHFANDENFIKNQNVNWIVVQWKWHENELA